jgi:hypothetical protein
MKKLVFKISNLLEDNGFLDVENGEIASPEKIRENAQRRYEDDQLSRDDRHRASLKFTNMHPIFDLGNAERWHLFITIINFLKKTPVQYIDLENAVTRSYRWQGQREEVRRVVKFAIDQDYIQLDGSLRLNVKIDPEELVKTPIEQRDMFFHI